MSFSKTAAKLCARDKRLVGEWAWKQIEGEARNFKLVYRSRVEGEQLFDYVDRLIYFSPNRQCWQIAVSCFGKQKIGKRLEALKE